MPGLLLCKLGSVRPEGSVRGSWGPGGWRPTPSVSQCGGGGLVPSLAIDPGESPAQRVPVTGEGDRAGKTLRKGLKQGTTVTGFLGWRRREIPEAEGMEHITPGLKPAMSPRCHAQPPPQAWSAPSVPFQFLPSQAPAFALVLCPPAMSFPRLVSWHPQRGPP